MLREQDTMALHGGAGIRELCLGAGDGGLGRPHRDELWGRVERRESGPFLHDLAHIDIARH
jgi:hypothetical protein